MAKTKPAVVPKKKTAATTSDAPPPPRKDGIRETVESVVIAFVLAFLFRAFEAEAFVIPTGSMAPTLMGVHKDLACEKCGIPYRISASEEQDEAAESYRAAMKDGRRDARERDNAARALAERDVIAGVCPNCRFQMDIDPQSAEGRKFPTYKGDRILVSKFPYDFADPQRWDVVVFKYPQTANENYIKRCIGLPNETIVIYGGNIYTHDADGQGREIKRKPPDKVRAIMQTVYDNDYTVADLAAAGLSLRWNAMEPADTGSWQPLDGLLGYRTDGSSPGESWLGYQHRLPSHLDWSEYAKTKRFVDEGTEIPPRLISDFYAYNAGSHRNYGAVPDGESQGLHWVGDLILECDLTCEPAGGGKDAQAILRLVRGGRTFDCRIDVTTGQARMAINGEDMGATAQTKVSPGTRHTLSFANVDAQLILWVDGSLIEFDKPTTYEPLENDIPTIEDLTPARIGSQGAGLQVEHLRLSRDVYYIATQYVDSNAQIRMCDYKSPVAGFLAKPTSWPSVFASQRSVEFPLRSDEFLMLGDNSPRSADSRLWRGPDGRPEHYVKRDLLVGKAVFVYWPHSWNRIPGTKIPFPFFPNFARMKFVR
jgi:signal peptidase I